MKVNDIRKKLLKKPKKRTIQTSDMLSSGITLFNLAATDTPNGCLVKGIFHSLVGDSDTGKSLIALSILTEAALDPNFKNYNLVFNNAERSKIMDLEKYFPPLANKLHVEMSRSPEEMYYNLDDWLQKGPCVYFVDSMDALIAKDDDKKFKKLKSAARNQKDESGSYGTAKAKVNANNLNRACSEIEKNGSILVFISQTHDTIGGFHGFGPPPKSRSGGRSLKFYNRWEVWLKSVGQLTHAYKGKKLHMGSMTQMKIQKNHITGKKRTITVPVYNEYGVDDVGSCIDYLLEWKHWKGTEKNFKAPEFKFAGSREELIQRIESKQSIRLPKLREVVANVWTEVESAVALKRKPKYEGY